MTDWTSFEEVKTIVLYSLVAITCLVLICVCGICGFLRTHKHVYQGNERKSRSRDDLVSDRQSPTLPDVDNEEGYGKTRKSKLKNQNEPDYFSEAPPSSNHLELHRTDRNASDSGSGLREKYLKQMRS